MKGLLAMSLGLIGLQVLLTSRLSDLAPAVAWVAGAAAAWIDPTVPLIPQGAGSGGGSAGGKSAAKLAGSDARNLQLAGIGQTLGHVVTGGL